MALMMIGLVWTFGCSGGFFSFWVRNEDRSVVFQSVLETVAWNK